MDLLMYLFCGLCALVQEAKVSHLAIVWFEKKKRTANFILISFNAGIKTSWWTKHLS